MGRISCKVLQRRVATCHSRFPHGLCAWRRKPMRESTIYIFEICDAILTVFVVSDLATTVSLSCVLCIGNQAALAALFKGATSSEL